MIKDLIYAGFSAIWHRSVELDEAQLDLTKVCDQEGWTWYVWDCVRGLRFIDKDTKMWKGFEKSQNPLAPVTQDFPKTEEDQRNVVLLHNYHRFLENPQVVQAVINAALRGKSVSTHYVVLSPVSEMPVELERTFTVVEHPLPGEKELSSIAEELARDASVPIEQGSIEAAKGLTRKQAENAFSLSIRNHGKVEAGEVWDLKRGFVNDRGYLSFSRGGPSFKDVGGFENLKSFCRKLLTSGKPTRGVLLFGFPGVGKSLFARALGNEVGIPTLLLDFPALFHKHVGESQRQLKDALQIAESMGRVILFLDELEKSLGGASSDGDSGVSQQMLGSLLTYLSDREYANSQVFVVATVNDAQSLTKHSQGALVRAERFDGLFMMDLPNKLERAMIWSMYQDKYKLRPDQTTATKGRTFSDEGYTGAEIKSVCRLASTMDCDLYEASQYVVPVSITAAEKIKELRTWASGRCVSASYPGFYQGEKAESVVQDLPRRKVTTRKDVEEKE